MAHRFHSGRVSLSRLALLVSASVLALTLRPAAQAQTSAATAPPPPAQVTGAPDSGTALSEIVVTASRRLESSQKAALAIDVVTGDALVQAGVTQVKDLSAIEPGLNIAHGGAQTQIYIRGVGSDAANDLADGAVAFNLDGVYIARPTALNTSFYDVSRVEILKGPQGTLYGRNATGGAINLITNNPILDEFSGAASFELGDYSLETTQAALNVPITETLAARAAFFYTHNDGYLSDGTDDANNIAGRFKLLFEPTDDLSFLASFDYAHEGGKGNSSVAHPAEDPSNPWLAISSAQTNAVIANSPLGGSYPGSPFGHLGPQPTPYGLLTPILNTNTQNSRRFGASVDAEWDLGFATLTVLPAFREAPSNYTTWDPGFLFEVPEREQQFSFETRLGKQLDWVKWVVGAYYFDERGNSYLVNYQGPIGAGVGFNSTDDQSFAFFGEATVDLAEGLRGIIGARYTHEEKTLVGTDINLDNAADDFSFLHDVTFNADTWKLGFEYDLMKDSLLYFTASTGFKSGGFFPNAGPDVYQPEKLTAYELGVKNRFFDNTLELNAEAFRWDYTGRQFSHLSLATTSAGQSLDFPVFGTFNAGSALIEGFEVSGKYRVTPDDTLSVQAQYDYSEYTNFVYSQPYGYASPASNSCLLGPNNGGFQSINCTGRPLSRSPRWAGTVGWTHIFGFGEAGSVEAAIQTHLSSSYWLNIDYISAEHASGYSRSDLDLTYRPQSAAWSLTGYVHNLENTAVYTGGSEHPFVSGLVLASIMPPRTFGGRFSINF
jgi:iron complex outermembrane receptor protein